MRQTFYIFRHGETFATKAGTGYGIRVFTAPILEEGIPTLEKMGVYLKDIHSDYNVSSQVKRCRQTVAIIGKESKKEFVFDKRLNEYFIESFGHFRNRIKSFLLEMEEKQYETILICTHGAVIAGLISLLTGKNFQPYNLFTYPEPGVLTIIKDKTTQQINFNEK